MAEPFELCRSGFEITISQCFRKACGFGRSGTPRAFCGTGERTPRWLSEAALYGLSAGSARTIQWILPGIGQSVDAVTPTLDSSVRRGFSGDDALPQPQTEPTSPTDP